jgi:glucose-1-phosphate thymidylyltransferase
VKGIVLAGGTGSRLYPCTIAMSKQLLPVYNKPLIYYPLSVLILAGIREILIITAPGDLERFERLLGDGSRIGMSISYSAQPRADGIAQALTLGRGFLGSDSCALILGDNIFYGMGLTALLRKAVDRKQGATTFAYRVKDPQRYGIAEFDHTGSVIGIEEKPDAPKSEWALTGLYFYDNRAPDIAADLKPSARGELEITDVNLAYLAMDELNCERMGRGITWLDVGTVDFLHDAAAFVQTIERRQGLMIACIEEIAFRAGFIDAEQLLALAHDLIPTDYGKYLEAVAKGGAGLQ